MKAESIVGWALRLPRFKNWATGAVALQFFCLLVMPSLGTIAPTCWDAASDFNDSANPDAANPSGVWSYGWKKTVEDKFYLALTPYTDPPSRFGWCNASGYPAIGRPTRAVASLMHGPNAQFWPPYVLFLHPGVNGEYAVVRFTAPADGTYKVSGRFSALDDNGTGTTTDVWVLPRNQKAKAVTGQIDYYGGARAFSFTTQVLELKSGETVDFEVGYGANKSYEYDSTALAALIEKTK